jgi:hypothetical protein
VFLCLVSVQISCADCLGTGCTLDFRVPESDASGPFFRN